MEIKYLVCPGLVRSMSDNEMHYVNSGQLMSLYKVDPRECKIVNSPESAAGVDWDKYIILRPNTRGDYSLPKS